MTDAKTQPQFAAYFRPTGKAAATRYGVGAIGVVYDSKGRPSGIDTEVVVAITHAEFDRFSREYGRQVREGALERVDAAAHDRFVTESAARGAAAQKRAATITKKASKADEPASE